MQNMNSANAVHESMRFKEMIAEWDAEITREHVKRTTIHMQAAKDMENENKK